MSSFIFISNEWTFVDWLLSVIIWISWIVDWTTRNSTCLTLWFLVQIYTSANDLYSKAHRFDHTSRNGPKVWWCASDDLYMYFWLYILNNVSINVLQAFVSEYAVTGTDAGRGSLLAGLAEAAFLIGIEKNRFAAIF